MGRSPRAPDTAAKRARQAMLDVAEAAVVSTLMDPRNQQRYEQIGRAHV